MASQNYNYEKVSKTMNTTDIPTSIEGQSN